MSLLKILVLAIVQGLAELLPVSSSAHVVAAEKLMGLDPSSPAMTLVLVMLHTGTMFAVIAYFWNQWKQTYFASADAFKRFALRLPVQENHAISQVNMVARNSDNTFYQVKIGLAGLKKYDDVTATGFPVIDEGSPGSARGEGNPVDEHVVAHQQRLLHRGRRNLKVLKDERQGK